MSNEELRNQWFGFIDLDALDRIAAGQQAARDVEIKAKALEIAEALMPDARAVDSVESASEALNKLPAYIEKKSIRPGRSVLELAVDPTGQMDMDEREYLALKLARVYPYKLDAQDLEWISA
jgi:phosphoribosylpyrophosphate synthetase